jgi:predicted peptidase
MIRFTNGDTALYFPADDTPGGRGRPLILFLHGRGERGQGGPDLDLVAAWGLPKFRRDGRALVPGPFPFSVLAPQCPPDRTWSDGAVMEGLDDLLRSVDEDPAIDPDRVYLTGFSMGGIGAFALTLRHPRRFAAVAPVCGACETPEKLPALAHLPAWIAYGEDDEITDLTEGSRAAAERLRPFGRLVERPYRLGYADGLTPHVRTCDGAYGEPELYHWFLAQTRHRPASGS